MTEHNGCACSRPEDDKVVAVIAGLPRRRNRADTVLCVTVAMLLISALHVSEQSVAAILFATACCSISRKTQSLFYCCPDLCYEDDSGGLIQGGAIHVDSCAQWQHKLDDAVLAPHLLCTLHAHLHLVHACQQSGGDVARHR